MVGKQLDRTGKALGLAMVASILLENAGRILKEDKLVYSKKNKLLINRFLEANLPMIAGRELLSNLIVEKKTLEESSKILGYELDPEVVLDSFTTEQDLFVKIIYMYLEIRTDGELTDMWTIINQLYERKRVYTQEDLLHKIEVAVKDFCNLKEVNKDLLCKYL